MHRLIAIATALASLAAPVCATAAEEEAACLSRADLHSAVAYFLPSVIDAAIRTCSPGLPADAFLTAKAPMLSAEIAKDRDKNWPGAKAVFVRIGSKGSHDKTVAGMPDSTLRPFVDAALGGKIAGAIKPESCSDINRIAATLAPLPAGNWIDLVSEVVATTAHRDRELGLCPA